MVACNDVGGSKINYNKKNLKSTLNLKLKIQILAYKYKHKPKDEG